MTLCPIYFLCSKSIPAGPSAQPSGAKRYSDCSYSIVTLPGSYILVSRPQLFSIQLVVTLVSFFTT